MSAPLDSDGGLDYAEVARAHMADLFRYARSLCRDVHQAEDLVQDTLLRGWRGHASLRDIGAVKAWLLTTLRREFYRSLDHARINKAHLSLDDTDAPISDEELAARLAALANTDQGGRGGYQRLYVDHVLQADDGCDFDFLVGCRGAAVPRHSH